MVNGRQSNVKAHNSDSGKYSIERKHKVKKRDLLKQFNQTAAGVEKTGSFFCIVLLDNF